MQRCVAFSRMYYCGMLSLYREFSDNDVVSSILRCEETEFLFVVADVPKKWVSDDPYAEDKTHIQLMNMPGVALKILPEGELITGDVDVRYPQLFQTAAGKTLWDPREVAELEPFTVIHARGSHHFHERSKEHYVDIWEILPDAEDGAMEQLLARIAVPVELDSKFGPLVLDRSTNTFDGRAEELGVDFSIWYEGEELLLAESANLRRKFKAPLTVINKVLSAEFIDEARRFAAKKLFELRTAGAMTSPCPRAQTSRHLSSRPATYTPNSRPLPLKSPNADTSAWNSMMAIFLVGTP